MIEGILIDLDNTLYAYAPAHTAAWERTMHVAEQELQLPDFDKTACAAREQIHRQLAGTAASHNRLLYFQRALELAGCSSVVKAKKLYDTYWDCFLEQMQLFPGVLDFLRANQHRKICVLTDLTAWIQYRKLIHLQITPYVHELVSSEEAGVEKPDGRMFELALQKLKLPPEKVCMIGDSYERDIQGALRAGIKPYWKIPADKQPAVADPVVVFHSFEELAEKIK